MRIYREKSHDIIFEDWWSCKRCKAKGPQFNKRKCTTYNANNKRTGSYDAGDDHDHKIRNTGYTIIQAIT
eukprot:15641632-Heterocapsa_arctica.AAC.1